MKIINDRNEFYKRVITLFTELIGNPNFLDDEVCIFGELGNVIVHKHDDNIQVYVNGETIDYPFYLFDCYSVVDITGNSIFYYGRLDIGEVLTDE